MTDGQALAEVLSKLPVRHGHFLLESGHHGSLWMDLELLFHEPRRVKPLCSQVATIVTSWKVEAVCGPLVEGSFVALTVAAELGFQFYYSERYARPSADGLFQAGYRLPAVVREHVRGKRVAIVNDVVNAGSAVRGTLAGLRECGAEVVGLASLLILGEAARELAAREGFELGCLASLPNELWVPADCPLCAQGTALEDVAGFQALLNPA